VPSFERTRSERELAAIIESSSDTWSPIGDHTGVLVGASASGRDFDESAERWRLASEAARLGMWCWNIETNRLTWTPLCWSLFGLDAGGELGRERWVSMLHPADRARVLATAHHAVATASDYRAEYRIVWPDGSVHWLSSLGRFYGGAEEEGARMLGVVLDVTPRKRSEEERDELLEREQIALVEARAATRAKDEFLAMVSHELRTPLQAMLGWTKMLKSRAAGSALLQKGLATIERNVMVQAELVEDLLDVSRIVAGRLRIERARVDLAKVVDAALDAPRVAAGAKSIRLDAAIDPGTGAVLGDPQRLQQIVSNLVSNAVKFTPDGGHVRVLLSREGTTARIVVEDDGRGISPELLPHVFERFRQAEDGTTRRQGGLGLGLSIVHHLVREHAGSIRAESPGEGRGAKFIVTLPLLTPSQGLPHADPAMQ
jgi:PAS domain S-box-containing protein